MEGNASAEPEPAGEGTEPGCAPWCPAGAHSKSRLNKSLVGRARCAQVSANQNDRRAVGRL